MILRTIEVTLDFNPKQLENDIRDIQFDAYRAWLGDITDMIDDMWRGWVVETGRSRRGFSVSFDTNTGNIEILNNAISPKSKKKTLYAQYVHRAGTPRSNLYIDVVVAALIKGPIKEMIDYIESELEELLARSITVKYKSNRRTG